MSSPTRSSKTRARKNVEDLLVLGLAAAAAVYGIVAAGPVGLLAGAVLLSLAGAFVVRREVGTHDPAEVTTTDERILADGGEE